MPKRQTSGATLYGGHCAAISSASPSRDPTLPAAARTVAGRVAEVSFANGNA